MVDLNLTYGSATLPQTITQNLIDYATTDIYVPPSYLITKLHYEGLWGSSAIGQADNNWGGMTWVTGWSDPKIRPSGVTVTRGQSRPANEGGYYIHYNTVNDFIIDWSYLIRRGGIYKVADSETFALAVKGMFRYGGATYDYATMNVTESPSASQERYTLYLAGMEGRRNAINDANANALDEIDNGNIPDPDPDPTDPDPEPEPDPPDDTPGGIDLNRFTSELLTLIDSMLTSDLYAMGKSKFYKNSFLTLTKQLETTYKIKASQAFYTALKDKFTTFNASYIPDPEPAPDPDPDPEPDPDPTPLTKVFPVKIQNGINFWKRSNWGIGTLQRNMTYGIRSSGSMHFGYDIGGGGVNHTIYSVTKGEVIKSNYANGIGNRIAIKNDNDSYYLEYGHLKTRLVALGDTVESGEAIGIMGDTGGPYAIHLDLKIATAPTGFYTSSTSINPETYLKVTTDNTTTLPEP